ncbi:uncharacterized protein LOC127719237 [Mytilus californianus]|uniref:uncharacterized protein LOC127719237 n=1 Tax=Mytilus californianus TaxID=6549 RepID=UPI002246009C|nr:uncharacterized protein LOC127719237 [Mytilus californianus]
MGTGTSKTKLKDEFCETKKRIHYNMVTEQSTTGRDNHTEKLSTPVRNQTPKIQTADDEKESKHKKQRRKKNKNVLNAIAQKPSGTDIYNFESVSANEILKFVVTNFENGCTFEDFLLHCDLFPSSVEIPRWLEKHTMQFHIFKNNEKIEYILPYVKTAGVCSPYNNRQYPGQCNYVNCRFLHVCRRFVRHVYCNFKGCRLAHDFTNQHNSRLIVRFGLENFSENQIKMVLNNHFPSICKDYNFHERCKVGTKKCVNLHLCGSYKFGKCEEPCKYKRTHKLNKDHNKWVLRAFEMTSWPEEKILKSIYVPPKRAPSYSNTDERDFDHNKNIDLDENYVPPKAGSSDSNSDADES